MYRPRQTIYLRAHQISLQNDRQRWKWVRLKKLALRSFTEYFLHYVDSGTNLLNGKSVDEIIDSCDKDGNGMIDYDEFRACILG